MMAAMSQPAAKDTSVAPLDAGKAPRNLTPNSSDSDGQPAVQHGDVWTKVEPNEPAPMLRVLRRANKAVKAKRVAEGSALEETVDDPDCAALIRLLEGLRG